MTSKKLRYIIFFVLGILVTYIVFDSTSQPNVNDLKGDFKEVALYRNENNTGPVIRLYAVTVKDTLWAEMKKYGDLMPYTKYGNTEVYFFETGKPAPNQLQPIETRFNEALQKYCLAKYLKDSNGQVSLSHYPFKP